MGRWGSERLPVRLASRQLFLLIMLSTRCYGAPDIDGKFRHRRYASKYFSSPRRPELNHPLARRSSEQLCVRFLRDVEFETKNAQRKTQHWGSELSTNIPSFQFENVLLNDWELLRCLETLRDVGLMLIKKVPEKTGQVRKLAERIARLRYTSYGEEFTVKSKFEPSNLAYTGHKLGLHTDLPHYHYTPSIQFLHCIKQCIGDGGDSNFSDGFNAALQLKEQDPEFFEILSTTYIEYVDVGHDQFEYYTRHPQTVFTFDQFGDLFMVLYNNSVRTITMPMPKDKVYGYYRAMKAYDNILNSPANIVRHKMQPGDLVVFNNVRVLHGREAFNVHGSGERHLEGGYIDWDDVHSRIRVLRTKFDLPVNG
ncbi:gamma-butyrobetaine dioxygenase-like [Ptychodera flava]|uniref:gamma-butyrobetaine dioxygenase-like n=1 Tax=Ptychodera flava TaxID=63121 RepID=UPI003969DECE